ncbi:hypothetical protein TNCV_1091311 [Trichonephila clavipes]|nr:hypothetical protein TNCV_1091311 [Trichonephila clavipes]
MRELKQRKIFITDFQSSLEPIEVLLGAGVFDKLFTNTAYTVEVLKETMPPFGSLRRQLVDPVDLKTPKTLYEDLGSCATTGPNCPNGSNSLAIVQRTHLLV